MRKIQIIFGSARGSDLRSADKTCLHCLYRGGLSPKTVMPENTQIALTEPAGARRVSDGRRNRAARELNILTVSSKKLRNISTIGQFINEMGLLKYGNGRLLGSAQLMAQGAQACAEMALKDGLDENVRQGYMELQLRFLKALDENVALQLEVNKAAKENSRNGSSSQSKSFLPGAQISPIQINISPSGTVVETKEKTCNS